jgi:hypothetical protein
VEQLLKNSADEKPFLRSSIFQNHHAGTLPAWQVQLPEYCVMGILFPLFNFFTLLIVQ